MAATAGQTTFVREFQANPSTSSTFLNKSSDQLLSYRLPKLVDATQKRWLTLLKAGATTSSVLTLVSVQLMIFYKNLVVDGDLQNTHHHLSLALTILSYCTFLFNLTSVSVSILLLSRLANLQKNASRRDKEYIPQTGYLSSSSDISMLRLYSLDFAWRFVVYYWIICLLFGFTCLLAQTLVYVWMAEVLAVKAVTTALVGLTFLPAVVIFLLPNYCII
ncbi:hypothetical protein L218DRAFT_219440 [Marasmius fiardii PR-910]|nr:hypothetical protein L218DRAFT_219440 [Marasmius fiardii PR-910]